MLCAVLLFFVFFLGNLDKSVSYDVTKENDQIKIVCILHFFKKEKKLILISTYAVYNYSFHVVVVVVVLVFLCVFVCLPVFVVLRSISRTWYWFYGAPAQ